MHVLMTIEYVSVSMIYQATNHLSLYLHPTFLFFLTIFHSRFISNSILGDGWEDVEDGTESMDDSSSVDGV